MEKALALRQAIIDSIEGKTGSLTSVPYHMITTVDLLKLQITLFGETKEYWQYMNRDF